MNSGELLNNLNRNIDRNHHKKPKPQEEVQIKHEQSSNKQEKINKESKDDQSYQQNNKQDLTVNAFKKQQKHPEGKPNISTNNMQSSKASTSKVPVSQTNTIRSNLTKASQLSKKNTFKQNFELDSLLQAQELQQNLHEILSNQIGKLISQPLAQVIEEVIKRKQDTVYVAFTSTQEQYLQNLLLQSQGTIQSSTLNVIDQFMSQRQNKTLAELEEGKLYIDRERAIKSKSQIQQLNKLDVARLLKIKQGTIRSKLDLLHDKMFQLDALQQENHQKDAGIDLTNYQKDKIEEITDPQNFALDSEKTKIAKDYVKHLQQQKLLLLKKMREKEQKRKQIELQREQQLKQAEKMKNAAKKQEILQKFQLAKKKKQQQIQNQSERSKKVEEFLKQYRKSLPLYLKKQKQFKNRYLIKKQKQRQQKLKQMREYRKSMSLNEIKSHQQKYLQRKSLQRQKRAQQHKMILKTNQVTQSNTKQYFKGIFHDKVKLLDEEEKIKIYSMRQNTRLKRQRMTQFQKQIRQLHKPKLDPKKKQQIQRIKQFEQMKKKRVKKMYRQVEDQNGNQKLEAYYEQIPEIDHIKTGNQYMQVAKSLAKKKQHKSQNDSEQIQIDIESLQESKVKKNTNSMEYSQSSPLINKEKNLWKLRGKQLNQLTSDINAQSFEQVKKNLSLMDQKAQNKEALLKHKQCDAHESLVQKGMLDEYYLESIRNKIKLLNE